MGSSTSRCLMTYLFRLSLSGCCLLTFTALAFFDGYDLNCHTATSFFPTNWPVLAEALFSKTI